MNRISPQAGALIAYGVSDYMDDTFGKILAPLSGIGKYLGKTADSIITAYDRINPHFS
ncbi:hypothetical protein [Amphritea pacifica]|uniref:Uncharacterized protein n=1 Tax=Amphritea pacifica TaxID=2811233 RepID=A0ABS2WE04_9GAMM|nr:hypothetical protein [Amphritea pacifica]MBN0989959.1 hypothetical protein [Amphritea pacifica]